MIITQNMLKKWVNIPDDILEVTNQKIIEVESFEPLNTATNLVIGKVLTCVPHPNSDHLNLTTVDLGDRVEQIVCGAPNVRKDQYVVVAQVGTVLPGNFEIKKSKIRGEESSGMICSLQELGIDEELIPDDFKEGIYHFAEPKEIGSPALEALSLEGWKMTLGLTPNRSDLLSILGFAYDLASLTHQKVVIPEIKIKEEKTENPVKVEIKTEGCLRYYARHMSEVTIKESPWWLKSALLAHDIKPINNVVDISNYVLLEYGTPLHMFDAKKVKSNHIVVRDANEDEEVISLDGLKRILKKDDVVITDGEKPIAIGGVMGLENTMIDENSTSVILEAAYFDSKRIQKTSKRLNLKSDSSLRFERGIDDRRVLLGLERATELLIELADAKVSQGISEVVTTERKIPTIEVPKTFFSDRLGVEIEEEALLDYFDRYQYQVVTKENHYLITPPSYRIDLEIPADILEEIARMHGLNQIPMTKHLNQTHGYLTQKQKRLRNLRHELAHLGLHEVITYSLTDEENYNKYKIIGEKVEILMPLSSDKKVLRQSLLNGLLQTVSYNQNRQTDDVHLFEIGHVFAKGVEYSTLAIAMSGKWHQSKWQKQSIDVDFYVLKGVLDQVMKALDIDLTYETTKEHAFLHPYRQANIKYGDDVIGLIGEIHPSEQKALDINLTYVLELKLDKLLKHKVVFTFETISKYPNIERDLAIVVDEDIEAKALIAMIKQTLRQNLVELSVFDVYQGSHIETGKKSIAFNLVFNDSSKTLETQDVDKLMKKIVSRLAYEYKAEVRK
ncbi:phenylalanine--tRNA ligase subunit beta [Tenericutes bacterium MZ-XQ]|nr:phenylalanine--tRNA ligase subunit beta [Tenericutes bacterium MZ-XQ]